MESGVQHTIHDGQIEKYSGVFYYRQHFGDVLQKVFKELNRTYEKIDSRIKAEQFRQRVMLCFRMWEDNVIYPTEILINYQNIFLGLAKVGNNFLMI